MTTHKTKQQREEALLRGARIATSETVNGNQFLHDVQKEWEATQETKLARVTPRLER